MRPERGQGFTLVEVLIALAVTAFVAAAAFAGLSAAIDGVERTRAVATRTQDLNRALGVIARDLRQFVARPIRDEYGETEAPMTGGRVAEYPLTLTRTGWHNSGGLARSNLQRVSYYLDDNALWRLNYAVLDRSIDSEPVRVRLLDAVQDLELRFLPTLDRLEATSGSTIDTSNWDATWLSDRSAPGSIVPPPLAVELRLELEDMGPVRQLYALPPL